MPLQWNVSYKLDIIDHLGIIPHLEPAQKKLCWSSESKERCKGGGRARLEASTASSKYQELEMRKQTEGSSYGRSRSCGMYQRGEGWSIEILFYWGEKRAE